MEEAHQRALDILRLNRELLETLSVQLLETETIEGSTLHDLLAQVKTPEAAGVA